MDFYIWRFDLQLKNTFCISLISKFNRCSSLLSMSSTFTYENFYHEETNIICADNAHVVRISKWLTILALLSQIHQKNPALHYVVRIGILKFSVFLLGERSLQESL